MSTAELRSRALGPFNPINESVIQEQKRVSLTKRRRNYLGAFSEHYCKKNRLSKAFTSKHRTSYADQRGLAFFHLSLKELCFPLVFRNADGSRITDLDGNEYVDIAMDFGISLFGHAPPFLKETLMGQLDRGWALSMRPENSARAAELLCQVSKMDRSFFCQSGTEAVMTAVRVARHVSKRKKIVIFSNSYHGHSDGLLAFNMKLGDRTVTRPVTAGTPQGMVDDVIILEYSASASLEAIDKMKTELAAVVVEPVQSRGIRVKPKAFLKSLRTMLDKSNTALIFDEMITGFRLAQGGAQEYFDVKADIATYGKILGGGLSIGAVAGASRYLDAIDGGQWQYGDNSYPKVERTFFAGTHCQNQFAMSAAYHILKHLKTQGPELQTALSETCENMCKEINEYLSEQEIPFRFFNFCSLFRIEATERINPIDQNLFLYHLRDCGIMVSEVGNNFLSTAHSDADIQAIVAAVKQSISSMKQGGFFQIDSDNHRKSR